MAESKVKCEECGRKVNVVNRGPWNGDHHRYPMICLDCLKKYVEMGCHPFPKNLSISCVAGVDLNGVKWSQSIYRKVI